MCGVVLSLGFHCGISGIVHLLPEPLFCPFLHSIFCSSKWNKGSMSRPLYSDIKLFFPKKIQVQVLSRWVDMRRGVNLAFIYFLI